MVYLEAAVAYAWLTTRGTSAIMSSPERDTDLFDGLSKVVAASMGTIVADTAHLDLGYQVHLCCLTLSILFYHHGEPLIVNPDVCYTGISQIFAMEVSIGLELDHSP